ncbi:MAG: hypothetical protein OJF61_001802 [Rhodanobacteraceae bacterium]|jgi:hypothetical protein|nr:MAG: hypothetical protein OJF61_001802 [Rhodanobacteraceae bacterium]
MNTVYPRTSSLAIVSLIFGILAYVFLPFLGALIAVICGHSARSEIRRAPPGSIEGDGLALAGLILGWIQLAFTAIAIVFAVLVLFGAIAFSGFR